MGSETRVALYLRQSLDMEGTGQAIARQERACLDYVAKRDGWRVVEIFRENSVSASGLKVRPQFLKMIAAAKDGEFDVIVALHLDRLTRSLKDYLPLLDLAEKHGVGVTTVSGELDLTTDMGQTLAGVLAVFANGEILRKGRRQVLANEQRAEQGRPKQGGRRAYGYQSDGMTVIAAEAENIRKCYAAVLAGASLNSLAKELNVKGATTSTGGAWTHHSVRQVLLNARYAGVLIHRGIEVGPATWPAIIDEATYRSVAAILADPRRRTNHAGGERRRLMTGIAFCGVCADGKTTVLGGSRAANTPLYQCSKAKHLMRLSEPVDSFVEALVLDRLTAPDATELLIDKTAPDLSALNVERLELVARQDQAAGDYADNAITAAMMRTIATRTRTRIAEIDKLMSHSDRERVLGPLVRSQSPERVWKSLALDRKQAVLSALGTWTINKGKVGGRGVAGYRDANDYRIVFTPNT